MYFINYNAIFCNRQLKSAKNALTYYSNEETDSIMKTAFFGGSFNPPHSGHLGAARGALSSGRTDRILWAPGFAPPHKPGRPMAPFADRLRMVELLTAEVPAMASCNIEARLRLSPSYTIDILDELSAETEGELQLLIGGDSLRDLHSWHRAEELAERYEILTYPRAGETPDAGMLSQHWSPALVKKLLNGIIPGKFFEISSTNIRNHLANRADTGHIMSQEIPDALSEYIRAHCFYQNKEEKG